MKKPKLLYVDDEAINLYLFREMFRNDFEVHIVSSGKEALEELSEIDDIQIVITDMRMPEMDGLQFISKAKESRPEVIYCLLTGYDITKDMEKAIEEKKVARYFAKPLDPAEIRMFFSARA